MGQTYWYAYDRSGTVSGPYFETKAGAADACADGETPRPIAGSVLPDDATIHADGSVTTPDDDGDDVPLDEMGHAELKAEAESRGIADDIDLRSKASIREALRDA